MGASSYMCGYVLYCNLRASRLGRSSDIIHEENDLALVV